MKYTQKQAKAMYNALHLISKLPGGTVGSALTVAKNAARDAMPDDVTPVIFRKFPDGDVVAMFPTEPGSAQNPFTCSSYMHARQHSAIDIGLGKRIPLASRAEFAPLKKELEGLGYKLKVITKVAAKHHAQRRAHYSL